MVFEIQAHRGARSFFPENTLQAFCKAADLGVRVVELDLVVSKDHKIVVSHDPWLSGPHCSDPYGNPLSTENRQRCIYDMAYRDIAAYDCGLPHPSFPLQQRIASCKPLLSSVFTRVDACMASVGMKGRMVYNLEIKSWPDKDGIFHPSPERYAELVLRLVDASGLSGRIRIQSFDYRVVREAWKLNPKLCYGLLIEEPKNMKQLLQRLGFLPQYVNPHFSLVDREMAEYLHADSIRMLPWTVNSKEDMLAMKHSGADGIITDYPELALSLFGLQQESST
jgi:glycerophosphoryl diester phosphodiesterase